MDPLRLQLTERLADLVCTLSSGQAEALALEFENQRTARNVRQIGGLPAPKAVHEICDLWQRVSIDGESLADAVRCAARAVRTTSAYEKVELLYTGPGADTIRRTKQGLLEVIRSARMSLWVVSYVVTRGVDEILAALRERAEAGVAVNILVDHRIDGAEFGLARLARDAAGCQTLIWPDQAREFAPGQFASLHAKCAVADQRQAFVSSANLTGHAMEHNLEVGFLVTGGATPQTLARYLDRLVEDGVLVPGAPPGGSYDAAQRRHRIPTQTVRNDGRSRPEGHTPRVGRSRYSDFARNSLSFEQSGPARITGHGQSHAPLGGFRERLLLAWSQELPEDEERLQLSGAEVERRVLAVKDPGEPRPGRSGNQGTARPGLHGPRHLGMQVTRPGVGSKNTASAARGR